MDIYDIADRVTAGLIPLDPEIDYVREMPADFDLGDYVREIKKVESLRRALYEEKKRQELRRRIG